MIRIRQIEVPIDIDSLDEIKKRCAKKLNIKIYDIIKIEISKQSLDARKKPDLFYIYEVDVEVINEEKVLNFSKNINVLKTPEEKYEYVKTGTTKLNDKIIIVGAGPAGLFCAYVLAENGYKPLVIERGEKVEDRIKSVSEFWDNGKLNTESNVQFGEGGAGTFSDGKLTTQIKDSAFRKEKVLKILIESGAPQNIAYLNKPHIGTDLLRKVVINMRNKIISMGGTFKYNTCLTDIIINDNKIKQIEINKKEIIDCEVLVLALGHSARDTFKMLYEKKIDMQPKPFALGIRIQHLQEEINMSQYGYLSHPKLEAASYKLTYKASNGRGVYSFCMCPGGYVVNSSSEKGRLAINGMSNHARDSKNANSALIVTINPSDFGNSPLDGIEFQRKLEEKAYEIGKSNIPIQIYKDYKQNIKSTSFENIKPELKGNYEMANLNDIFPEYINEALKEAIEDFDKKIKGFASDNAILSAVESRTSSPIKIIRNEYYESNIKNIYPCGEGAGYAGGITSAAIDGIKIAEELGKIYI
ncbi:MAG: NAD(P)/FAD-dependent oxidoreductase [Bacilli bacterium]|nr:NAD(P)/FAD-dependent oxidoreductase [Bacilli bacterium]